MEKIPAKGERGENTIYDHCLLEFLFLFLVFLPYIQRDEEYARETHNTWDRPLDRRERMRERST